MDDRRGKRGIRARNPDQDEKSFRTSVAPPTGGGGIFKSAAVAVLRQHRKLMTTGDITRLAVDMGLLKCQGKTPEATMASALYTDVKRKLQKSLFTRPQEGLFGLREWIEEGYYPEGWVGPPDGLGLAPFKRRNNTNAQQSGSGVTASAAKAGRAGVRTGPGRSSKSKAARSWRNAASDGEDDDMLDDDDSPLPSSRSHHGTAGVGFGRAGYGGSLAAAGEDDDMEDAIGEGEDGEEEEEPDDGEDLAMEGPGDGLDDLHARLGADDGGPSGEGGSGRPQPSPSPIRRLGKARMGGGFGDGGLPQDECLSPLHMLGEAAASESVGDMVAEQDGPPPAKRKRPSSITVPERGGVLGGVEGVTPKSPYEDSLAALHEIATSPSTFELTSQRERGGADGGAGGSGKTGRTRPRLHVDVPSHTDLGAGPGSRRDGGTPGTTLLTDNPMLQGETTPAILLQASPVTTSTGQHAMMLRQAPVLVTLPPALASPSTVTAGQLDTPALVHVQLPGGPPSELMQTTLITPTGQLTPFRSQQGGLGQPGRGGLLKTDGSLPLPRPPGRRVSFSGQVGILGPLPTSGAPQQQPLHPPAAPAGGAASAGGTVQPAGTAGGAVWPPRLTPAQVESELMEIARVQTVVERLESKLGNTHPQVGKAWLAVSRMYQHISEAERNNSGSSMPTMAKAAEALRRAWAVCRACAESVGTTVQCEEAFRYLTARTSDAATEPTDPAVVPAAEVGGQGTDKEAGPTAAEGQGAGARDSRVQGSNALPGGGAEGGEQRPQEAPAPSAAQAGRKGSGAASGADMAASAQPAVTVQG